MAIVLGRIPGRLVLSLCLLWAESLVENGFSNRYQDKAMEFSEATKGVLYIERCRRRLWPAGWASKLSEYHTLTRQRRVTTHV